MTIIYLETSPDGNANPFPQYAQRKGLNITTIQAYPLSNVPNITTTIPRSLIVIDHEAPIRNQDKLEELIKFLIGTENTPTNRIVIFSPDLLGQTLSKKLGVHFLNPTDGIKQLYLHYIGLDLPN